MSWQTVTVVRIYLTEAEGRLDELVKRLHDREGVRGVTVYRGITGYGRSGTMHESRWPELAADLPLTVEFFDRPGRIEQVLADLEEDFAPGHILTWPAKANLEE
jgi:PII-like signaling protein